MAISFVGAGTVTSGTGSIAAPIPAGTQNGDLLWLIEQGSGTPPGSETTTPTTTRQGIGRNIAADNGLSGVANAAGLKTYWRIVDGTEGSTISVADQGDHVVAVVLAYRGVDQTNPFVPTLTDGSLLQHNCTASSTPTTSITWPIWGGSGNENHFLYNCTIMFVAGLSLDAASTTALASFTPPAGVTSVVERVNQTFTTGTGGGIVVEEGLKAADVTITAATGTMTSCGYAAVTVALRPSHVAVLSSPTATSIGTTSATPQVTVTL